MSNLCIILRNSAKNLVKKRFKKLLKVIFETCQVSPTLCFCIIFHGELYASFRYENKGYIINTA